MKKKTLLIYILFEILGIGIILVLFLNLRVTSTQQEYIEKAEQFFNQINPEAENQNQEILDQYLTNLGLEQISYQDEYIYNEETQKILETIENYLNKQLAVKTNTVEPIPEEILIFLNDKEADINTIINYLNEVESVSWQYDIQEILQDPLGYQIPNFGSILSLQKIFMVYIYSQYFSNNQIEINRTLEASFTLNKFVQSQPYFIPQVVSLITVQHQMRVIRQMAPLTYSWVEKLDDYNYEQGILNALTIEAYANFVSLVTEEKPPYDIFYHFIQQPYTQMMFNDIGSRMLQTFSLLAQENICSVDNISLPSDSIPWWNILGEVAAANLTDWWFRSNWVILDMELTKNVLRAENIRQTEGNLPENLDGLNSELCMGESWDYVTDNDQAFFNLDKNYLDDTVMDGESIIFLPLNFTLK